MFTFNWKYSVRVKLSTFYDDDDDLVLITASISWYFEMYETKLGDSLRFYGTFYQHTLK